MPADHPLRERQALVYYGLRMAASSLYMQHAAFVSWVLVSYTLPIQLNLSPPDLDSALLIHRPLHVIMND